MVYCAGCAAIVGELAVTRWRAPRGLLPGLDCVVAFGAAQALALMIAGALMILFRAFTSSIERLRQRGAFDPERRYRSSDFIGGALLIAPLLVAASAAAVFRSMRAFANQELAAVLAALGVLGLAWLGILGALALATTLRTLRESGARAPRLWRIAVALGIVLTHALVLYVGVPLTGASQLDPALLVAPLAAAAGLIFGRTLVARLSDAVLKLAGTVSLLLGVVAALASRSPSAALSDSGAWSKPVLAALRATSDFDGDGYSAWFGGGDCAPWDPAVHPGATERLGNGVDENCAGGDGHRTNTLEAPRPTPGRLAGAKAQPDLVLVTIETLRADRVSFLGYSRPTMPQLERLAAESVVFERVYATTPTTRLSLPALLSGVMPSRMRWEAQPPERRMRRLGAAIPWLPEILRARGYATIAVHTNFRAFTGAENAGFDRGFEAYDTTTALEYSGGTMRGFPGERQVERALEHVDAVGARPIFLWAHLVEPHYLYEQPPDAPKFGTADKDLYDAEIAEADRQVGRLLDGLHARGRLADAWVLVAGDHGEEFGEHGERWHTSNLYEPQVRTAALLRLPGFAARRIQTAVSLTDLAPTVLDLLGYDDALAGMQGRNLVSILDAPERPLAPFFLENFRVSDGQHYQVALIAWPYKLIYRDGGSRLEVYDVARDPAERHNLHLLSDANRDEVTLELLQRLHAFRDSAPR